MAAARAMWVRYKRRIIVVLLAALAYVATAAILWRQMDVRPRLVIYPETWDGKHFSEVVRTPNFFMDAFPYVNVAFSPDGRWFATCTRDKPNDDFHGLVQIWEASTGREQARLLMYSPEGEVEVDNDLPKPKFSPDGRYVTVCYRHAGQELPTLHMLDVVTGQERTWHAWRFRISLDGQRIALVTHDQDDRQVLIIADTATGRELAVVARDRHGDGIACRDFVFLADGRTLAVTTEQYVKIGVRSHRRRTSAKPKTFVMFWDIPTGRPRREVNVGVSDYSAISPDGKLFANHVRNLERGWIDLWDAASSRVIGKLNLEPSEFYDQLRITDDGSTLIAGADSRPDGGPPSFDSCCRIAFWNLRTRQLVCKFEAGKPGPNGTLLRTLGDPNESFLPRFVLCRYANRDGKIVEVMSGRECLAVTDAESPSELVSQNRGCALSPDQSLFVLGQMGLQQSNILRTWMAKVLPSLNPPADATESWIRGWDMTTGQEFPLLRGCRTEWAFSPDSRTLLTCCDDGTVKLWDLPPRKPLGLILAWASVPALLVLLFASWRGRRRLRTANSTV
jgi:WD40 repeat protein